MHDDRETPPKPALSERGPVPPGRCDFELPLGPLRIRILGVPTTWEWIEEHYSPFCEPLSAGAPDLVVECREELTGLVVPLPPPGGSTVLDVWHEHDERYAIQSHWQTGFVDVAARRGVCVITDRGYIPVRMALENFLRIACQLSIVDRGAFLMHTAGVVDGERCFLFFGPSGAGKSTATMFSEPRPALSDDMVLLEVAGDVVRAHAVPFFGAFPPKDRLRGAWPVAGALRLHQSADDRLVPLSPARAVATISASIPFVHELGVTHEGLTGLVARFVTRVPVMDLHLRRGPGFWTLIDDQFKG